MAKHKLLPSSATPERIGGHSWAGDGMKPTFLTGGVNCNLCVETHTALVLFPKQMTQVQKQDGCKPTITSNITNERPSLIQDAFLFLLVLRFV